MSGPTDTELQLLEDIAVEIGINFNKVGDRFSFTLGGKQCPASWATQAESVAGSLVMLTHPAVLQAMGAENAANISRIFIKMSGHYGEMEEAGLCSN